MMAAHRPAKQEDNADVSSDHDHRRMYTHTKKGWLAPKSGTSVMLCTHIKLCFLSDCLATSCLGAALSAMKSLWFLC